MRPSPADDSGVGGAAVAVEGVQIGERLHHEQLRPAGHLQHAEVSKLTEMSLERTRSAFYFTRQRKQNF